MSEGIKKTDFVQSIEKGLKVISAFGAENPRMTLTEVATMLDMTRANARRILLTLQHLGYVTSEDGKWFSLTAKVLSLGYSFLSSQSLPELARPFMQQLTESVNESCSLSVLDGSEIVYTARVQTKRIMTIALGVGTRLPAHATSMGKALLANLSPAQAHPILEKLSYEAFTSHTLDKAAFLSNLDSIREQGYAIANQELEIGVRSIACPVRDKAGCVQAALNISGHASRVTVEEMKAKYLPALQKTVTEIEAALHQL